jgi:hypothetical protein
MFTGLFKGFWQGIATFLLFLFTAGVAIGAAIVLIFVK